VNVGPNGEESRAVTPHIFCKACASPLVQASDWSQEDAANWHVRIWCPECGFEHEAILGRSEVAYLSFAIEGGFAHVLEALAELQDMPETSRTGLDLVMRLRSERIAPAKK
jgi:hypothetical protein